MPVNLLPCITSLALVVIPLLLFAKSRRVGGIAGVISVSIVAVIILSVFIPGWRYKANAERGDAAAQYRYAQWIENHEGQLAAVIVWPETESDDTECGFEWLETSASNDYPPAIWLVGVRLKYGKPQNAPYEDPELGQEMIDKAKTKLGYQPPMAEELFYWHHYRRGLAP